MHWHTRKVLSWRAPNTMDSDFCVEALEEALPRYGTPEIFNTDQGTQFTADAFTRVLKEHEVTISMDGKARWIDNVFVERLWRSVKYEDVYLRAYETLAALRAGLDKYFRFYNTRRPHTGLDRRTPRCGVLRTNGVEERGLNPMEISLKRGSKFRGPLLSLRRNKFCQYLYGCVA